MPESLDEFVPDYLDSVPIDPYTRKPMQYTNVMATANAVRARRIKYMKAESVGLSSRQFKMLRTLTRISHRIPAASADSPTATARIDKNARLQYVYTAAPTFYQFAPAQKRAPRSSAGWRTGYYEIL